MGERGRLAEQGNGRSADAPEQQLELFRAVSHQGPIPDPSTLAGYRDIDPTFPERIMAMAERDQAGQLDAVDRISRAEVYAIKVGMTAMVALSALSLIAATILILLGYPAGAALLALPIMTALPQFIAALRGKAGDDE